MKCTFSIQMRNTLVQLLRANDGAKVSYGQIEMALGVISKLEYTGDKEDGTIDTTISLSDDEIKFIHSIVQNPNIGWSANDATLKFKKRLQKYVEESQE